MKKTKKQLKFNSKINWTYFKYVFLSMLKKPYVYVVAGLYVLFLIVLLIIVPKIMNAEPLYSWNATWNFVAFNLLFIAIINSTLMVGLFKQTQEDNSDLNLCAKPLKKSSKVFVKIIVYLIISLVINGLCVAVASLTKCNGWYSLENPKGITPELYKSLLLSIFVGNSVCMTLFGAIALLIGVFGPTIIVMVGTISVSAVLAVGNFVLPKVITNEADTFAETYGFNIESYCANTSGQYISGSDNETDLSPLNYASILSYGPDRNFDTYEYWTKSSSQNRWLNYLDIGNQLCSMFKSFDLSNNQKARAARVRIGSVAGYDSVIEKDTGVKFQNKESCNYPIGYYTVTAKAGMVFPKATIVASNLGSHLTDDWSVVAPTLGIDFYCVTYISSEQDELMTTTGLSSAFNDKISYRLSEIRLSEAQQTAAITLFNNAIANFKDSGNFDTAVETAISNDTSGLFFDVGKWKSLSLSQKYNVISKLQYFWAFYAQQYQISEITSYKSSYIFPYTSDQLVDWYKNRAMLPSQNFYYQQEFINNLFTHGIKVGDVSGSATAYSLLTLQDLPYCESFSNLYRYHLDTQLKLAPVASIWATISVLLFAVAIIKIKKQDIH